MKQILSRKIRNTFALCLLAFACAAAANAQTTVFTYQGRLTDSQSQTGTAPYLMQFSLYQTNGTLVQTLTDVPVTVTNGVFTVQLNFTAANAFNGDDRFLEIAVKRNAGDLYVVLNPRQQITSAPYAIRALNATNATNATTLNGTAANQFVLTTDARLSDARTPTAGSSFYIQNTNAAQTATFNITGAGTVGTLNAGNAVLNSPAGQKALEITRGRVVLSYATVTGGTTEANAGTIPTDAAVIEAGDNGAADSAATVTLPTTGENGAIIVVGTSDADGVTVFGASGATSYTFNVNQSARFTRIAGAWKFLP